MLSLILGRGGFVLLLGSFPFPFGLRFLLVYCLFGYFGYCDCSMRGVLFVCIFVGLLAPLSS